VANRDDHAEAYRVFNMGMVVYTDRDNLEHALVHLESHHPKPIGDIKERGFVIVNGIKLPYFSIILKRKSHGFRPPIFRPYFDTKNGQGYISQ
jgi:hypothetical protein